MNACISFSFPFLSHGVTDCDKNRIFGVIGVLQPPTMQNETFGTGMHTACYRSCQKEAVRALRGTTRCIEDLVWKYAELMEAAGPALEMTLASKSRRTADMQKKL